MSDKLNVFDLNLRKTAILQNAYSITETQELNKIYFLTFSIPGNDTKTQYICPFHYVRYGEDGQLYRIIKVETQEGDTSAVNVTCEHVIATLCDDVMFGEVVFNNGNTTKAINLLLSKQKTKNWKLGTCSFSRKFEYLWSQENILNALYSIPKEFSKAYKWVFDTSAYPWTVSLVEINETVHPEYYIRGERNLLSSGSSQEFDNICTRIYPLGYGEGVNQLNISEITKDAKGNPCYYLESPKEIVNKYGIKEKILADRRFENAESLKQYAKTMLDALQTPGFSRSFDVVDLYPISSMKIDNAKVGDICKMMTDNTIAYITKTTRVLDDPGNLQIELSTKATDVADTIADLADRVRIESVYAQGATQLYQHSKDANATPKKGMIMSLYFPSEMVQINKVLLRLKLGKFRAYSSATETAAKTSKTTSTVDKKTYTSASAAKTTGTTSSGGGSAATNAVSGSAAITGAASTGAVWAGDQSLVKTGGQGFTVGGGDTSSADGDGEHTHGLPSWSISVGPFYILKSDLSHTHGISLPDNFGSHSHTVSFNAHSHSVTIPAHKHNVTIPAHNHTVTIPAHKHAITPGIFESGGAESFTVYVSGKAQKTIKGNSYDGDITSWLLNEQKQIPRNSWIDIDIRPDDLAYIQATVFVQGFVQSRGGGNY